MDPNDEHHRHMNDDANSQSNGSQDHGGQDVAEQDMTSPFRLPNDEEVFIFRESEKQKKLQIKQQNKNMRIW